jgi:acetyltransferase-like isoleucine patch superfamily enzyme
MDKPGLKPAHRKVTIGSDVWIGERVTILPGVQIGHGAIVGAGAVVTKDVHPYSIVVGIPARVMKYRFTEKQIVDLLKIRWWDWEESEIKDNLNLMLDVQSFIDKHRTA